MRPATNLTYKSKNTNVRSDGAPVKVYREKLTANYAFSVGQNKVCRTFTWWDKRGVAHAVEFAIVATSLVTGFLSAFVDTTVVAITPFEESRNQGVPVVLHEAPRFAQGQGGAPRSFFADLGPVEFLPQFFLLRRVPFHGNLSTELTNKNRNTNKWKKISDSEN